MAHFRKLANLEVITNGDLQTNPISRWSVNRFAIMRTKNQGERKQVKYALIFDVFMHLLISTTLSLKKLKY